MTLKETKSSIAKLSIAGFSIFELFLWGITLFLLLLAVIFAISHPVQAESPIGGPAPNYSESLLPNLSYVHQGENISQGNYYDLTGIYGFSGELAHWNNDDNVGIGMPDQIVTLSGRHTEYIAPEKYPVGRWWQWDGVYCTSDSDVCSTGFGHGNAYVFYVNPIQKELQTNVVVLKSNITVEQNGSSVQIPVTYTQVQTYYGTPMPTPTEEPTLNQNLQDQNGNPIVGGVSGAIVVTPKSPLPVWIGILAIITLIVVRKKK